jgi:hypothetical protein
MSYLTRYYKATDNKAFPDFATIHRTKYTISFLTGTHHAVNTHTGRNKQDDID